MSKTGEIDNPPAYTGYGQPQPAGYGQPQPAGYAQPQPAGYGQPEAPYGQPQQGQPQYGMQAQYGQTATSTVIVSQPGQAGVAYTYARPPDYMVASIFACLCCFWPTGLCAIYFASQANNAAAAGDMDTATRMSRSARNLMITSVVLGVVWITLFIILRVVVASSTSYNSYNY